MVTLKRVHPRRRHFPGGASQRMEVPVRVPAFDVYRALRAVNPSPYMYYLRIGDSTVLGSSPEMLVKVRAAMWIPAHRRHASARKSRRGQAPGRGPALRRQGVRRAHHAGGPRPQRRGPRVRSSSVQVREMMFVERYSHVMHLVSQISGQLRADADSFAALAACFPPVL